MNHDLIKTLQQLDQEIILATEVDDEDLETKMDAEIRELMTENPDLVDDSGEIVIERRTSLKAVKLA